MQTHINAPMDPDFFVCCICKFEYDQVTRIPKLIPICGHTFCLDCLSKMANNQNQVRCPLDQRICMLQNHNVGLLPTNILMKQIAEYRTKLKSDLCDIHEGELKNLVCLTDKCKVCKYCVDYGVHNTHNLKYIKDVEGEAMLKKEYLEKQIEEYNACFGQVYELLASERKAITKLVITKFDDLKIALDKQKFEMLNRIDVLFDQKRNKKLFSNSFMRTMEMKRKYEDCIETLNGMKINQTFFTALDGDLEALSTDQEYDLIEEQSQELKERLYEDLSHYSATLISRIQDSQEIKISFMFKQRSHPQLALFEDSDSKKFSSNKGIDNVPSTFLEK